MTPYEFAQKHFNKFKVRNNWIVPQYCPYCLGGDHRDKETFAMNLQDGNFVCKRGKCGRTGSFAQLCRDFGEVNAMNLDRYGSNHKPKKNYRLPKTQVKPVSPAVEEYLKKRGFSPETWQRFGIGDDGKGNIAIPHTENGKVVFMKFRHPYKVKPGEQKEWQEGGGKPIFWGIDYCTPDKPLVITEGVMDALALYEAGIENVISLPNGSNDLQCIDLCWDWLQPFEKIILWVDSDEPGQELQRQLINRLGVWRCWTVECPRKDANEVLYYDGKEKVRQIYENAKEVPISNLVRLAEVKPFDYSKAVKVLSGLSGLDEAMGGFIMGQFSVWTGLSGSGKSTLLGQLMLDAIEQGYPVCAYSGELTAPLFRYWIDLQAAGSQYVEMRYDSIKEKEVPYTPKEIRQAIQNWYYDKFFLYDTYGTATENSLFEIFEYAARRHGCRVFMIDNLMMMALQRNEQDYWFNQKEFIIRVAEFAMKFNVHVHVVAHPRKTEGRITKNDIFGTSNIRNRADNILCLHRLNDEEKLKNNCDAILEVFKDRINGEIDYEIQLNFDPKCKRFYMPSETSATKQYGWVEYLNDTTEELPWEV